MGYNRAGATRKERLRRRLREEKRLAARWEEIDPRTLDEMPECSDCHLVPDWCGVSGRTVRLRTKIDNDLGTSCEGALKHYPNVLVGN